MTRFEAGLIAALGLLALGGCAAEVSGDDEEDGLAGGGKADDVGFDLDQGSPRPDLGFLFNQIVHIEELREGAAREDVVVNRSQIAVDSIGLVSDVCLPAGVEPPFERRPGDRAVPTILGFDAGGCFQERGSTLHNALLATAAAQPLQFALEVRDFQLFETFCTRQENDDGCVPGCMVGRAQTASMALQDRSDLPAVLRPLIGARFWTFQLYRDMIVEPAFHEFFPPVSEAERQEIEDRCSALLDEAFPSG